MTKDQIVAEAMSLPFDERQKVAEQLMLSLSDADRERIDAAWLAEAKRRDEAASRGEVKMSPVDEAVARVTAEAMTVVMNEIAEADLDRGFAYYESLQRGLGTRFVTEFRRAIERILTFPRGWHAMDDTYRRCQLHVFP